LYINNKDVIGLLSVFCAKI